MAEEKSRHQLRVCRIQSDLAMKGLLPPHTQKCFDARSMATTELSLSQRHPTRILTMATTRASGYRLAWVTERWSKLTGWAPQYSLN